MSTHTQITDAATNTAAVVSGAAATYTWLVTANEVAQLVASIVAIITGCFAIVHYWRKIRK